MKYSVKINGQEIGCTRNELREFNKKFPKSDLYYSCGKYTLVIVFDLI